jgi:hypothetical protein
LFIFWAKKYSTDYKGFIILYGISQNPDTNDYILVQNNTINLIKWTSGNEKIDDLIQEKQLKINKNDVIFEWIPYNQFNKIEKTGKNGLITVYSAIWKDGPLHYNSEHSEYARDLNKGVVLKYLYNSQNPVKFLTNKV